MISHEKLVGYLDASIVCGGFAFVLYRSGQIRLPIPKAKREFISLSTQLILTIHFSIQTALSASKNDSDGSFLFYLYLTGALFGFISVLRHYTLWEGQLPAGQATEDSKVLPQIG